MPEPTTGPTTGTAGRKCLLCGCTLHPSEVQFCSGRCRAVYRRRAAAAVPSPETALAPDGYVCVECRLGRHAECRGVNRAIVARCSCPATAPAHGEMNGSSIHSTDPAEGLSIEALCEVMHNAYERAAVEQGWATQEASRKPWADVPDANKATMRVAVAAVAARVRAEAAADRQAVERVRAVLDEWGALDGDGFAEDFAEAVADSGAWRLARDFRRALGDDRSDTAQDAQEAAGDAHRGPVAPGSSRGLPDAQAFAGDDACD